MYASVARPWSTWTGSTGTRPCSITRSSSLVGCIPLPTLAKAVSKCNYVRVDVRDFPRDACAVGAALEHIGDRWTMLVLRDAFFGVRRFGEFRRSTGAAKNILSDRLGRLVDAGILPRERYSERPPRDEDRLTEKGPGD